MIDYEKERLRDSEALILGTDITRRGAVDSDQLFTSTNYGIFNVTRAKEWADHHCPPKSLPYSVEQARRLLRDNDLDRKWLAELTLRWQKGTFDPGIFLGAILDENGILILDGHHRLYVMAQATTTSTLQVQIQVLPLEKRNDFKVEFYRNTDKGLMSVSSTMILKMITGRYGQPPPNAKKK